MKYCKNCGSQLTDNAEFCHKCGTRIGNNNSPKHTHMPLWAKIALGIVAAFTLLGSLVLLTNGFWIGGIITLCALSAIIALFMGVIDKKYALPIALASLFLSFFFLAEAGQNEAIQESQTQTEQKKETEEVSPNNSSNEKTVPQTEVKDDKESKKEKIEKEGYSDGESAKYDVALLEEVRSVIKGGGTKDYDVKITVGNFGHLKYIDKYGKPKNAEEEELEQLYRQKYVEGFMTIFDD